MNNQQEHHDVSEPKTPFDYIRLFFTGFAMGSADIVPGVSGGTMAFILGIYEALLDGIKSFNLEAARKAIKFDVQGLLKQIPFRFLITLGLGIGSALLLLAGLLHDLLEQQPTFIFAFFAGLIIASILAIGIKVKWNMNAIIAFIAATIFAFFLVGLDNGPSNRVEAVIEAAKDGETLEVARTNLINGLQEKDYPNAETQVDALIIAVETDTNYEAIADDMEETLYEASDPVTLFFSGMLAICAMILPGISGSFILLILGQYSAVLGAVKNLDLLSIGAVGAGAAIGILAFSRVISWLLKHYENATVAALTGFMLGSLRLIWIEAANGVDVVSETGELSGGQWGLALGLIVLGFIIVSLLDHMQSHSNPVFAWFWRPAPAQVDVIAEKAEALD